MSNVLFALWMALSAGLLLLFFFAAFLNLRSQRRRDVDLSELIPSFLPVNVEILAGLVDPSRELDWRRECSREEREHQQLLLTVECLRRMTHNAALLQRLGYSQLHSPNQMIASLAQEMIDAGVHVRLYSFIGLISLRFRFWLQSAHVPVGTAPKICDVRNLLTSSLIPAYAVLKDKADSLTCLKFSSLHEELAESL